MKDSQPSPWLRLFPSLTDVAFTMPILFLLLRTKGVMFVLGDGDTGWHIRTGQWILANGRVPFQDLYSYTKAGQPWYAWEWLADVIFGALHNWAGLPVFVLFSLFLICLTFALVYRMALRNSGNVLLSIGVTTLAVVASVIHWLARPHLFTLLLGVIWYALLEQIRLGRRRLLLVLPPLMILWTNVHGGFLFGLLLLAGYGLGELLGSMFESTAEGRRAALRRSGTYWGATVVCSLATLVNPYFHQLHVHIFEYLTERYHFDNVIEFQSLSFHHPIGNYFESLVVLSILAMAWSAWKRRFIPAVLCGMWAHAALLSARNIPLLGIVAVPVIALMLEELLASAAKARVAPWICRAAAGVADFCRELTQVERVGRLYWPSAAAFALLAVLVCHASAGSLFDPHPDPTSFPVRAADKLNGPEFARGVFAPDSWGGYLIYRFYPATKVFIDGRSDFYGPKMGIEVMDTMTGRYTWSRTLRRYGVHTAVLPVTAALASTLKESREWRVFYDDGVAIILRRVGTPAAFAGETVSAGERARGEVRDSAVTKGNGGEPEIAKLQNQGD